MPVRRFQFLKDAAEALQSRRKKPDLATELGFESFDCDELAGWRDGLRALPERPIVTLKGVAPIPRNAIGIRCWILGRSALCRQRSPNLEIVKRRHRPL